MKNHLPKRRVPKIEIAQFSYPGLVGIVFLLQCMFSAVQSS